MAAVAACALFALALPSAVAQTFQIGTQSRIDGNAAVTVLSIFTNQFTVGASGFTVTGATALLRARSTGASAFVEIYADSSNAPSGPSLVTFTGGTLAATYSDVAFTPNTVFALAANTNYWFGIRAVGDTAWGLGNPSLDESVNGTVNDLYSFSFNNGASFFTPNARNSGYDAQSFRLFSAAQTSAVPEPSAFVIVSLFAGATGGLVVAKRRRK